ncbi:Dicarboxylate/amino acid:cation symporter [Candidatus Cyrtobacter comes]|uniref:Dicarboxylate/amino acid:cation symporter n=1 Tax=Candidatus Cyrtobacter comes TaxID=675776 RepID=A0ABU5L993_9RICK|nr:Dicarboxylate/amino acid:cation symporter [Candidatus Cyrtobacter comes]
MLLAIIVAVIFIDLPLTIQQVVYSISITIKSFIIMILPIVILCLLFKTIVSLSNNASKIIGLIFTLVCCSNFLSTFLSHYVGIIVYNFDLSILTPKNSLDLQPLWELHLPTLISNDKAIFAGIILGFMSLKFYPKLANLSSKYVVFYIHKLLSGFIYLIPLFIAGFIIKLKYDGIIESMLKNYSVIFIVIACSQFTYILLSYIILNKFNIKQSLNNLANIMPAAISGFSTMSSAASMPLTIIGAERNARNKDIARSVIPATVNIHLVGDCFAIPIFAYAVLKSFGMSEPSLMQYVIFASYFVLAKFSVAAIPGGGIIVMLPILQDYLGFNADMMSLITALYILFDPVITCANVLGNGAFAKLIDRIVEFKFRDKKIESVHTKKDRKASL